MAKAWHKALVALTLVAALLGVATFGTAHAYSHAHEHAAAASDCATCHAVKTGSTPVGQQIHSALPVPRVTIAATVELIAEPHQRDRAPIASRAPPLA